MTIINVPKYKDFNGKIHRTEKECINAENNLVANVFQMFKDLAKGCKNHGTTCGQCPFFDDVHKICLIEKKTGNIPDSWHFKEEE